MDNNNTNANFYTRLFAVLLDKLLINVLLLSPLLVLTIEISKFNILTKIFEVISFLLIIFLLKLPLNLAYSVILINKFGGTIGKLLFGLKVVDQDSGNLISKKAALLRQTAGYTFSMKFFGLGFLSIIRHIDNLGWHDELLNTKVLQEKSGSGGYIILIILLTLLCFMSYMVGKNIYLASVPFFF